MSMWIDTAGNNLTKQQVLAILVRSVGATPDVLDHIRVGGIYRNGGIFFQRMS